MSAKLPYSEGYRGNPQIIDRYGRAFLAKIGKQAGVDVGGVLIGTFTMTRLELKNR